MSSPNLLSLLGKAGIGEKIVGFLDNRDLMSLPAVSKATADQANGAMIRLVRTLEGSGHGLGKHCLSGMNLAWDPARVMTQFCATTGGAPIKKVLTALQVKIQQAKKNGTALTVPAMTAEIMLCLRVIGIDPITKLLDDEPNKTSSCAFRSAAAFTISARRMLEMLIEYRNGRRTLGKKDGSGELLLGPSGKQHRITFEFAPKKGGYAIHAPVAAILGANPDRLLAGFIPDHKFMAIAATTRQLWDTLKKSGLHDAAGCSFVLIGVSQAVSHACTFATGWIKAIILVSEDNYELFSLYPEPGD
jgi:hypothetical protein